jgi:two-component system OmpR family sensor kinase
LNRAFISLYFFLVTSIVFVGWGLNQVWTSFEPDEEVHSEEIASLFNWIEKYLADNPDTFFPDTGNPIDVNLISLDEISGSEALATLRQGKILTASTPDQMLWYKRIEQSERVIVLSKNVKQQSLLYKILILLFYLSLALVIYLWVWPLSRDAKKLELQTRSLGKDQLPEELHLSNRSTLYPLAKAFNQMLQRLRDLIASYKDMTNAVSHELRTPLARMKFALALIDESKLDTNTQQQLTSLTTDISEMESLINSLLIYAGFEQKNGKLQVSRGQIADFLEHIRNNFLRTHAAKPELVIRDFSGATEFSCEWKLIETAIQNLLGNAARFAVSQISLEVRVSDSECSISVDDDGPGIPAEERERVLESFVRLYDEKQESKASGFGLGLSIVRRIMHWHGGGIRIGQAPELGGARMEIYWPIKKL